MIELLINVIRYNPKKDKIIKYSVRIANNKIWNEISSKEFQFILRTLIEDKAIDDIYEFSNREFLIDHHILNIYLDCPVKKIIFNLNGTTDFVCFPIEYDSSLYKCLQFCRRFLKNNQWKWIYNSVARHLIIFFETW